ncbi:MAG: methionyl-tRNA formyltransferase, partial [Acidobacteriota bacterium]|nr:methionyl-tRNA formyltransferase [Acidobacteriota bacterium]
ATLAPLLRREDGLIDWSLSAVEIERRVRGFQPWPAAHTIFREQRLIVWNAEIVEAAAQGATTGGEVVGARGDEFLIACGRGSMLRVIELQLEGKRRMSARDVLNGMRVQMGERLG